jgi:hypothetical protein
MFLARRVAANYRLPGCKRIAVRDSRGHMEIWDVNWSWRRGSESNRRIKVLQTSPLPLGYRALN